MWGTITATMNDSAPKPNTELGERFPRSADEMANLRAAGIAAAKRMLGFIDASPTPFHAAANVARQLQEDGFQQLNERAAWTLAPGDRRYVIRDDSTIIAFVVGSSAPADAGYRIIGAHIDSPNLRIKPNGDRVKKGYLQAGVEIYGGVLLSTWLDRDLSVAGRVACHDKNGEVEFHLVDLRRPVARVSNLAIHLNRQVNKDGLKLNQQKHMVPMMGLGKSFNLNAEIAEQVGVSTDAIVGYDLGLYDTQKGALGGLNDEYVYCARLDNLASSYAAVEGLCGTAEGLAPTAVIALYDHEEVGSRSAVGAAGTALRDVLSRIAVAYPEGQIQAFPRAIANSLLVSADMAHAVHPNYDDKHDAEHQPLLNRGMTIKSNVNQRYATNAASAAAFDALCFEVGYEAQHFVCRSDMPCGSTIGPITAAELGIQTVDVGAPMLSMHSCRELAGTLDVHLAIQTFLQLFK